MVVKSVPFQRTVEVETKLAPFTVRVKGLDPAVTWPGEMLARVGSGLLILKFRLVEVPPPGLGLNTVMGIVAARVRSAAGITAVSLIVLT